MGSSGKKGCGYYGGCGKGKAGVIVGKGKAGYYYYEKENHFGDRNLDEIESEITFDEEVDRNLAGKAGYSGGYYYGKKGGYGYYGKKGGKKGCGYYGGCGKGKAGVIVGKGKAGVIVGK